MGQCCSERSGVDGKTKGGSGGKGGQVPGTGLDQKLAVTEKSKQMENIRNTITSILKSNPQTEILALTIPMADFAAFVGDMFSVIDLIHKTAKEIFIPIRIAASPIRPTDFIVVFRTHSKVQAFTLDGWFTTNTKELAKKFVTKTFKIANRDFMNVELTGQLKDYYAKEKLNLIGGFQDKGDSIQLLFFKQDRTASTTLELFIE